MTYREADGQMWERGIDERESEMGKIRNARTKDEALIKKGLQLY